MRHPTIPRTLHSTSCTLRRGVRQPGPQNCLSVAIAGILNVTLTCDTGLLASMIEVLVVERYPPRCLTFTQIPVFVD